MQQEIIKKQNEAAMLRLQYTARRSYNIAELLSIVSWLLSIVIASSVFVSSDYFKYKSLVLFVLNIVVFILGICTSCCIKNAGNMRAFFDANVLNLGIKNYSDMDRLRFNSKATKVVKRNSKKSNEQMLNTGFDNPPGVKDWYIFSKSYDDIDAVYSCQRMNIWWVDESYKTELLVRSIITIAVTIVWLYLCFVFDGNFIENALSSTLVIKFIEHCYYSALYYGKTMKIMGMVQVIERNITKGNLELLQKEINEARLMNNLGINLVHKLTAKHKSAAYLSGSN